jgi:hypothetical protein
MKPANSPCMWHLPGLRPRYIATELTNHTCALDSLQQTTRENPSAKGWAAVCSCKRCPLLLLHVHATYICRQRRVCADSPLGFGAQSPPKKGAGAAGRKRPALRRDSSDCPCGSGRDYEVSMPWSVACQLEQERMLRRDAPPIVPCAELLPAVP